MRHLRDKLWRLIAEVGAMFAELFGAHEHLDIVFIREDQEGRLRQVGRSSYRAR